MSVQVHRHDRRSSHWWYTSEALSINTLDLLSLPSGIFATFPFLLPNLVCAALLLVSILAGYFPLIETHPDVQRWSTQAELDRPDGRIPLMLTSGAMADSGVDLRSDTYGTFNKVDIVETKR